jgi:hypothetical protein
LLASKVRPQYLNLRDGEPKLIVCPDCHTWRALRRNMIWPHHPDLGEAGRPARCPGSGQRITMDITAEQWGQRLLEAEASAAARRSIKVLPKTKVAPAPAVSQLRPAPLRAETARQAFRNHQQQCANCKAAGPNGQPLPCPDGERLAVTFLRLLRQEPKRRAVREFFAQERRRFDRQYTAAAKRTSEWATVLPDVTAADAQRAQLPSGNAPTEGPSVPLTTLHPAR